MALPKVYVTCRVHDEALELMKKTCSVELWDSEDPVPRDELIKGVKGAHAIFCTIHDIIDKEVIDAAGADLKIVSTMSVGKHHISTLTCSKRDIYVANTPDVAADCAAELAVSLLLVTARRCIEGHDAVKKGQWGKWKPMWLCGTEMTGRTLGILGFGRVGFGVARRMKPFGLKRILYNDLYPTTMADDMGVDYVDFQTLIKESDFLVISCGLNGASMGLFNSDVFKKMKNSAILINTSRGQIVNTDDITQALKDGEIEAAGLDVSDPEPLPQDHPLVSMDNCVILPHLGTNSKETRLNMALDAARNIISTLK